MSKRLGLLGWIGLVFLASAGSWWLGHSWVVSREVSLSIESADGPRRWAVLWQGRRGEPENGAWIDAQVLTASETLELIVPGTRADGTPFRLWLDTVKGIGPGERPLDLRPVLIDSATSGRWQEFGSGGGIAFAGPQPGSLRLTVPGGGVELAFARTRDGGAMVAKYAGSIERLDCYSDRDERTRVTLTPSRRELAVDGVATLRLPSYDISHLRLAWFGVTGKKATIGAARVRTRLLGFTIRDETLSIPGHGVSGNVGGGVKFEVPLRSGDAGALGLVAGAKEPAGVLEFEAPRPLGVAWHLGGVGAIFAIAMAVVAVGFVLMTVLSFGRPRWLGVGFWVLLAVVGVRLWMGAWSPVFFCPDSVDYAAGGINWVDGGSLEHFRPIRVPGYAVFLAWLWQLPWTLTSVLSLVQGVMGVLTAIFAWSITRKLVGRGWAALAFLIVGLDPLLLAWERFAMTETLTAFLVTLVVWMIVARRRADDRPSARTPDAMNMGAGASLVNSGFGSSSTERQMSRGRFPAWFVLALAAGALVVVGVYVRGNFQILLPLVPLLLVIEARRVFGWRRAIVLGIVCLVASVGLLTPRLWANKRDYGVAAVMVASARNTFILAEPNGVMDMNHTRAFEFEEWREATDLRSAGKLNEWQLAQRVHSSNAPVPPGRRGSPQNADRGPGIEEAQSEFVVKESYARHARERGRVALAAVGNLIGFYPWSKFVGFQENTYWTGPLRGVDTTRSSNFFTDQAHAMKFGRGGEVVYRACQKDIGKAVRSTDAKIFNEWFMGDRALRPVLAGLMLVGLISAVRRREWTMAWICGVVIVHAVALAVLAMTGIDRYGVPFEPLLRVGAVYGLSVIAGWWGHGMTRTWSEASGAQGLPLR